MRELPIFEEARRQLTVCNACRYCEGLCPVFPALERRSMFAEGDIRYLANLCHDCRACMPACPYTDPHELAIDIPRVLTQIRKDSYRDYAFPRLFGVLFEQGARTIGATVALVTAVVVLIIASFSSDRLFTEVSGPGSFYAVVPWLAMVIPATLAALYGVLVMAVGFVRFWRDTDGPLAARLDMHALMSATTDVLVLRQMRGGGPGCTYPEDRPNPRRVVFHQFVFYGFLATFAATISAAIAQEGFGILPPYDLLSVPVILGTLGGVAQVVGCIGLLWLKSKSAETSATRVSRGMDVAFLVLLIVVNVTGLLLLAFRDSAAMGILLAVHLGTLGGLFIVLPYSKFVHIVYRYAALVRNRQEEVFETLVAA